MSITTTTPPITSNSHQSIDISTTVGKVKQVGEYLLGPTLGQGSFGKVKLATHVHNPTEKVAIKIVDKSQIQDVSDVERVYRETFILTQLKHINIIRLHDVLDTPTNILLVMEYANGGDLYGYVQQHNKLSEIEARSLFEQIINGVEYCHRARVIHRDLKLENILLDNRKAIKIADFGLSNSIKFGQQMSTNCGTPSYTCPEQIMKLPVSMGSNGSSADIWACGVILFAMVSGFLPFEAPSIPALFSKIKHKHYKPPPYVSTAVCELIERMLCIDPERRAPISEIRNHPWMLMEFTELGMQISEREQAEPVTPQMISDARHQCMRAGSEKERKSAANAAADSTVHTVNAPAASGASPSADGTTIDVTPPEAADDSAATAEPATTALTSSTNTTGLAASRNKLNTTTTGLSTSGTLRRSPQPATTALTGSSNAVNYPHSGNTASTYSNTLSSPTNASALSSNGHHPSHRTRNVNVFDRLTAKPGELMSPSSLRTSALNHHRRDSNAAAASNLSVNRDRTSTQGGVGSPGNSYDHTNPSMLHHPISLTDSDPTMKRLHLTDHDSTPSTYGTTHHNAMRHTAQLSSPTSPTSVKLPPINSIHGSPKSANTHHDLTLSSPTSRDAAAATRKSVGNVTSNASANAKYRRPSDYAVPRFMQGTESAARHHRDDENDGMISPRQASAMTGDATTVPGRKSLNTTATALNNTTNLLSAHTNGANHLALQKSPRGAGTSAFSRSPGGSNGSVPAYMQNTASAATRKNAKPAVGGLL